MVRKQNFSRKRQAILEALRNTKIHPTAEWVHQTLKNDYPDLKNDDIGWYATIDDISCGEHRITVLLKDEDGIELAKKEVNFSKI